MLKWSASLFGLAALLSLSSTLHAQASPTAIRGGGDIQAGVGVTFANGDYDNTVNSTSIGGISFWGNYGFTHLIGVEADVHLLSLYTPADTKQVSYALGPKFTYHRGRQAVYGKVMIGHGTFTYTEPSDSSRAPKGGSPQGSFIYEFGGGYEYRIKHHYVLRGDVALQKWPSFEPHTLSPILATVGVAYVIR